MPPPHDLLALRPGVLDTVDANDVDQIRAMWEACAGSRRYLGESRRLENLTWRMYSRQMMPLADSAHTEPTPPVPAPTRFRDAGDDSDTDLSPKTRRAHSPPLEQVATQTRVPTPIRPLSHVYQEPLWRSDNLTPTRATALGDVPDLENSSSTESIQSSRDRGSRKLPSLYSELSNIVIMPDDSTHDEMSRAESHAGSNASSESHTPMKASLEKLPDFSGRRPTGVWARHTLTEDSAPGNSARAFVPGPRSLSQTPLGDTQQADVLKEDADFTPRASDRSQSVTPALGASGPSRSNLLSSSVVRGFSPSSVSVAPSSTALRDQRQSHDRTPTPSMEVAALEWPKGDLSRDPQKMFFIAGSPDSDTEGIDSPEQRAVEPVFGVASGNKLPASNASSIFAATSHSNSSNIARVSPSLGQKTSTDSILQSERLLRPVLKSKDSFPKVKGTVNFAEAVVDDENSDDYEDTSDSDGEWDDMSDSGAEDELFQGQDVPLKPALRPSLLSSLILNKQFDHALETERAQAAARAGPSEPAVLPRKSALSVAIESNRQLNTRQTRKGPRIPEDSLPVHRYQANTSEQDPTTPLVESGLVPVDKMLHGAITSHIPYHDQDSVAESYMHDLEDVNNREMSQSMRESLLQSRGFELESLWPSNAGRQGDKAERSTPSFDLGETSVDDRAFNPVKSQRNLSLADQSESKLVGARRPNLLRSTTMPTRLNLDIRDDDDSVYDTMSYHATGW